jgi:hypothetical protein
MTSFGRAAMLARSLPRWASADDSLVIGDGRARRRIFGTLAFYVRAPLRAPVAKVETKDSGFVSAAAFRNSIEDAIEPTPQEVER